MTGIYNKIMSKKLPENKISCTIVPRKEANGAVISASTVRTALKNDNIELLKTLVPETTLHYFQSKDAAPVIAKIGLLNINVPRLRSTIVKYKLRRIAETV